VGSAPSLTNCLNASLRNIQNLCWCFRHLNLIGYILQLLGLSLDSLSLFTNLLGLISNFLGLGSDLLSASLKLWVIGSSSSGSSNLCCFSGDICSSIGNLRGVARNSRGVIGGSTSCITHHVITSHQTVLVKSSEVSGRMVSSLGPNIDPACCSRGERGYDHVDPIGLLSASDPV
jgi:hypothetical protein